MISKEKHQKHRKFTKPNYGFYGRNEFAILGAPCSVIQQLANSLIEHLHTKFQFAFVDATHNDNTEQSISKIAAQYIVDGDSEQITENQLTNEYTIKSKFSQADCTLINGNHFQGDAQIVINNKDKKDSLFRKIDRLTKIQLIVLADGVDQPFSFIKELCTEKEVPIYKISELNLIVKFIENQLQLSIPKLLGLLLAGGKSSRMGTDKSLIKYRNITQRAVCNDMLAKHCNSVYLSITNDEDNEYEIIKDTFIGLGPFGGLLSAFQKFPNNAILSLACDVPLIEESDIIHLVENRNPAKIATAFFNPATNFPEPLITIWEPKAYPLLLQFLSLGYSCPRKVLINSDIELINIDQPEKLMNANTPADKLAIENKLKSKV